MQKDIIKSIFFNDLVLFIRVIHVFIIWSKGPLSMNVNLILEGGIFLFLGFEVCLNVKII